MCIAYYLLSTTIFLPYGRYHKPQSAEQKFVILY